MSEVVAVDRFMGPSEPAPAIFRPNEASDTEEKYRPAQPTTLPTKAVPWSSDEDEALLALVVEYKRNWNLVSEALRTRRQRRASYSRTAWECFERYNQITVGGSSSNPSTEPVANGTIGPDVKPNIGPKDGSSERSKPGKFFSTFDIIRKCAKKRDQKQQQSNGTGFDFIFDIYSLNYIHLQVKSDCRAKSRWLRMRRI